jgi:PAS domain S-box-containing protein
VALDGRGARSRRDRSGGRLNIRSKTILVIMLTVAALGAAIFAVASTTITAGFRSVEDEQTCASARCAADAVRERLEQLSVKLSDWAAWDDTYEFMKEHSDHYRESNLNRESLQNQRIAAIVYFDEQGAVIERRMSDAEVDDPCRLPRILADLVAKGPPASPGAPDNGSRAGLLIDPDSGRLMLVASQPILTSRRAGPPRGTLLFAQWLESDALERVGQRLGMRVEVLDAMGHHVSPVDRAALRDILGDSHKGASALPVSAGEVRGYSILDDITGAPRVLVRISASRGVYRQGLASLRFFGITLLAVAGVVSLVILTLLERMVLARVERLSRQIDAVQADRGAGERIEIDGSDELSRLGETLNAMLESVRAAGQSVRESERRFRELAEHAPAFIWMLDADGELTFANGRGLKLLGCSADELSTMRIEGCIDPAHRREFEQRLNATRTDNAPFAMDVRVRAAGGREMWMRAAASPRRGASGECEGVIGLCYDITLAKLSLERLADSELKFRLMFESSPVAIAMCGADGLVIQANADFLRLIGRDENDVSGVSAREIVPEGADEMLADMHGGEARRFEPRESELIRGDGSRVPVLLSGARVRDASGRTSLWVFAEDLTARIDAEVRLRRYAEDLVDAKTGLEQQARELEDRAKDLDAARSSAESANRTKGEFLANMSHEIRTPMTAILGYADLLLDPECEPDQRERHVRTIRRNGEHLLTIINDILDLSKIESGRMSIERIECSPRQIFEETTDLLRDRAASKGVALRVAFADTFPTTVRSDPVRLRQILMNLVGNAVKFTERGEIRVECDFQVATDGASSTMTLRVRDTGIGMTPEQVARLFQPFSQADSSTARRFGGTGLGLTITKRLVEMLGGVIAIRSEYGKGTTFEVVLPSGPSSEIGWSERASDRAGASQALPHRAPRTPLQNLRILLAEDGEDNQRLIDFHLKKAGALVTIVENGARALEILRQSGDREFDLVLLDMQMPVMDGYTAARALRDSGYTGSILALTANAMQGDREKCIAAGCNDHIGKPIDKGVLIGACWNWTRGPAGTREQAA